MKYCTVMCDRWKQQLVFLATLQKWLIYILNRKSLRKTQECFPTDTRHCLLFAFINLKIKVYSDYYIFKISTHQPLMVNCPTTIIAGLPFRVRWCMNIICLLIVYFFKRILVFTFAFILVVCDYVFTISLH